MHRSAGPASYERDDQLARRIDEHYRLSLERIVSIARDAGAEVILVTPASNLKDFPPFKSEPSTDEVTQHRLEELLAKLGSFAGRENRVFPREVELSLFGHIDPYARGEVRIEAGEVFERGDRVTEVSLAEANLTLLTLPFGTQVKLGLLRNRFGMLNQLHLHEQLPDALK